MNNDKLLTAFQQAEHYVRQSKFARWTQRPAKHLIGLFWSYFCYPIFKKGLRVKCVLFTGDRISVLLPAGLDLYLTGVKSHSSELRLVRYMLSNLKSGDVVIDAGAHLGYYTMVMAACVSGEGTVVAFEPSAKTGEYLRKNALNKVQVRTEHMMLAATKGESTFQEFSLKYSEFNTSIQQVSSTPMKSTSRVVPMTSLDEYCKENDLSPSFMKIDVEGGEYHILKGATKTLQHIQSIAIELRKDDYQVLYAPAVTLLEQSGFAGYRIDDHGRLSALHDVAGYISNLSEESDNVVFKR